MQRFTCAVWVLGSSPVYERVTSIRLKISPSVLPRRSPRSVPIELRYYYEGESPFDSAGASLRVLNERIESKDRLCPERSDGYGFESRHPLELSITIAHEHAVV